MPNGGVISTSDQPARAIGRPAAKPVVWQTQMPTATANERAAIRPTARGILMPRTLLKAHPEGKPIRDFTPVAEVKFRGQGESPPLYNGTSAGECRGPTPEKK